jgi:hypothetical protein
MSEYTRYLLASAGIDATEQVVAAVDASGHPGTLVSLLFCYIAGEHQCEEIQPGVFQHTLTPPEWDFSPSYASPTSSNWSDKSMRKAGRLIDQIVAKDRRAQRKRKVRRRQRRAAQRRHNGGRQ